MVERKHHPEPPLPTFVQIVTWLELIQCCVFRFAFVGIIGKQLQVVADSMLQSFLLGGLVMNLCVLALGGGGCLATLAHRRYGPSLMGLGVLFEVGVMGVGILMNTAYLPPSSASKDLITVMLVIDFIYILWLVVLVMAISKASSIFTFVDAPRTASQDVIATFVSSVAPKELDLSENRNVKDPLCEIFARQRQLTRLNLSSTWVTDAGVAHLASLPYLARLDLSDTRVTNEVFQILSISSSLVELRVAGTACTAVAVAEFAKTLQASRPESTKVEVTRDSKPRRSAANDELPPFWAPAETPDGEAK